ncbi:MAG: CTP synthase [Candidatus Saccharibacteria bacterium]|nr:CTP synthase [Candidatus Saccharibacteria bacterium]
MKRSSKTKPCYIVITGGVVSGSGKGITAASIGACLKARQFQVNIQKFDMYLNVDAGTLKPGKHGEVFVTVDGAETDLDLGHYERFLDVEFNQSNSVMQGAVLKEIIEKERAGDFLGDDIQVIPHVTSFIQDKIVSIAKGFDVHIVELGGTIGDYEGLAFVEATRQLADRVGRDRILYVHVVYLPYLQTSGEVKTKPAQNSVRDLRSIGIIPDILVARCETKANHQQLRQKLNLFTGIEKEKIGILENAQSVYQVPLILEKQNITPYIASWLGKSPKANLSVWRNIVRRAIKTYHRPVKIGMIAKYLDNLDTYHSLIEAMKAAAWTTQVDLELVWVDAKNLENLSSSETVLELMKFDGILIPGGFGERGINGMIQAATYAIHNNVPYLGICLGMQIMTIAYARLHGLSQANSKEFDPKGQQLVITYLEGQKDLYMTGGTMRLGSYECHLKKGSQARQIYNQSLIKERHRHRFEFNPEYTQHLESAGLQISGICPENKLVEIVEIPQQNFMIGCQFHPEFSSRPMNPHPLIVAFLRAVKKSVVI